MRDNNGKCVRDSDTDGVFYKARWWCWSIVSVPRHPEIFAAAMRDYGRALIVGEPTAFGKDGVQQYRSLNRIYTSDASPGMACAGFGAVHHSEVLPCQRRRYAA
ncbi:hypothetical protein KCP70_00205 [Salmonella enterica subsp. enterica]|nr:hypothetical protein KCP70_00205 [Salmonella enterica subsp. enterica]